MKLLTLICLSVVAAPIGATAQTGPLIEHSKTSTSSSYSGPARTAKPVKHRVRHVARHRPSTTVTTTVKPATPATTTTTTVVKP
ncbi:MAG TPA: hypothetical protein VL358_11750 [Caulobacteraceae bacterium]|jgi:hypothetical protein|nr:hypothetical protein [Caulobacteraceae bacterium]